jgi:hypothetical protein
MLLHFIGACIEHAVMKDYQNSSTQIGGIVSAILTNDFFEKRLFTLLVRLVLVGVDARSEV